MINNTQDFLARIYGEDCKVNVRLFSDNKTNSQVFSFPNMDWEIRRHDILSINKNEKFGAYFIVNKGGYKDAEITQCPAIFADFDNIHSVDEKLEAFQKLSIEPHIVIQSSKNSYHFYWLLDTPCLPDIFTSLQKQLVHYGADPACCNPARLMRLPFTYNFKEKNGEFGFLCSPCFESHGKRYSVDELQAALTKSELTVEQHVVNKVMQSVPIVSQGNRNVEAFKLAAKLKDGGLEQSAVLDSLSKWNASIPEPLADREILSIVKHAYRYSKNEVGIRNPVKGLQEEKNSIITPQEQAVQAKVTKDSPRVVAARLLDQVWHKGQDIVLYNGEFYLYSYKTNAWSLTDRRTFQAVIAHHLDKHGFVVKQRLSKEILDAIEDMYLLDNNDKGQRDDNTWRDGNMSHCLRLKNGIFNMQTQELLSHTPDFFSTTKLDFNYDKEAHCAGWLGFLESIWDNDEELKRSLQLWFAYCLSNDFSKQKMAIMIGESRAGKGVLTSVLDRLMGNSVRTTTMSSLCNDFGLQGLEKARLIQVRDISKNGGYSSNLETALETLRAISGRDPVVIHRKYLPSLDNHVINAKIVITANELPNYADAKGALANRMLIFPFEKSFAGKEDTTLAKGLAREMPGILNWTMDAYVPMFEYKEFLFQAQAGKSVLDDIRLSTDSVLAFVSEAIEPDNSGYVTTDDIYSQYKTWMQENGKVAKNKMAFMRDFLARVKQVLNLDKNACYMSTYKCPLSNKCKKIIRGINLNVDNFENMQ